MTKILVAMVSSTLDKVFFTLACFYMVYLWGSCTIYYLMHVGFECNLISIKTIQFIFILYTQAFTFYSL